VEKQRASITGAVACCRIKLNEGDRDVDCSRAPADRIAASAAPLIATVFEIESIPKQQRCIKARPVAGMFFFVCDPCAHKAREAGRVSEFKLPVQCRPNWAAGH
jgi:hypothetical protein